MIKKLEIDYKKTCSCPDNHTNCLTAKDWVRNQVAIWEFFEIKTFIPLYSQLLCQKDVFSFLPIKENWCSTPFLGLVQLLWRLET